MKKYSYLILILITILFFKCLEIHYFDKDQNIDMSQIKSLGPHFKNIKDFFLPYPIQNGTYRWSVTGFGPLYIMQKYLSGNVIYLIMITFLFLVSFKVALEISRSTSFAIIFSYFLTLGYNHFIVFFDTRVIALIFFIIYGLLNFLFFYQMAFQKKDVKWGFLITLILLIFAWDSWIDYSLTLGALIYLYRPQKQIFLNFGLIIYPFYFLFRFLIIGNMGEITIPGRESDFIFNYNNYFLMMEDFLTNIIRYIHTALSNYFPLMPLNPLVINSPRPIDLLEAFAPGATFQQDAIYYNYLYGWYLFAGITFSIYCWAFYKFVIKNRENFVLTSGLIFIFFGGFTHYFIKFRPLLVLPYNYTYRQYFSIIGITLILSLFGKKIGRKKRGTILITLLCLGFTGMSFLKTKRAIDHSFIHNKLNPPR